MRNLLFVTCLVFLTAVSAAYAQSFELGAAVKNLALVQGVDHAKIQVPILPTATGGGFLYPDVTVSSDVPWISPTVNVQGQAVVLAFNTASLSGANFTGTVTVEYGAERVALQIDATLSGLNAVMLLDDPQRVRMYGLQQSGAAMGGVVFIHPTTGEMLGSVSVGNKPTDMALSKDGHELFVINCGDKTISVIDLKTGLVTETLPLPSSSEAGAFTTTARVAAGPGNLLYYTEADLAPVLRVYDRRTHQVVQVMSMEAQGFWGDFALDARHTVLTAWAQVSTDGGPYDSKVVRFNLNPEGRLTTRSDSGLNIPLRSLPLDAPVLITHDGKEVVTKNVQVELSDLSVSKRAFPKEVYSISSGGEIAVTEESLYATVDVAKVLDLPVRTKVHAITSDYSRLVYFDPVAGALGTLDLGELVGAAVLGRTLSPADGASVLAPETLTFPSMPEAESYRLFFGTSLSGVTEAIQGSTYDRGVSLVPSFPAPPSLTAVPTYYWRVDTVSGSGVIKGQVHSFTVSPVFTSLKKVVTATVQGLESHHVGLPLNASQTGTGWTATADKSWVSFRNPAGSSPDTLDIRLNTQTLSLGIHRALISLHNNGRVLFTVPVELLVEPLAVTHLEADPNAYVTYGISEAVSEPALGSSRAYLIKMDMQMEKIVQAVPVGGSVTDLALNKSNGYLYVPNWKDGKLRVYDKLSMAWLRTFEFSPPSAEHHNDVRYVAVGNGNRLVLGSGGTTAKLVLFDLVNGKVLDTVNRRKGMGAFDSTGSFYYHGENAGGEDCLHKLGVAGNKFTDFGTSMPVTYGETPVIVAPVNNGIFWHGAYFDNTLYRIREMPEAVYSTSNHGHLVFGEHKIYYPQNDLALVNMPVTTKVTAYHDFTRKLVVQKGDRLRAFPINYSFTLSTPALTSVVSTGPTTLQVNWSDATLADGYNLQYRREGDSQWIPVNTLPFVNQTSTLLEGLLPGVTYQVRILATGNRGFTEWSQPVSGRTDDGPSPAITLISVQPHVYGSGLQLSYSLAHFPTALFVDRALSAEGPWERLPAGSPTLAYFNDFTVKTGVSYFYRITATRDSFSGVSNVVSGLLPSPVFALGLTSVDSWSVKLKAENTSTSFSTKLERRLGNDGPWEHLQDLPAVSAVDYTDSQVTPNTAYSYRMRAQQETRVEVESNTLSVITVANSAPPVPLDFRVLWVSDRDITLTWTDGPGETSYRLERAFYFGQWEQLAILNANRTSYTDSSLTYDHTYYYRLSAINDQGASAPSSSAFASATRLVMTFEDDFDPDLDANLWSSISGGSSVDHGPGFNGSRALYFPQGGYAQTRNFRSSGAGIMEFSIRAGNMVRDGMYWSDAFQGEKVILEYTSNGTTWTTLHTFDLASATLKNWANFAIPIPPSVYRVRWRHQDISGKRNSWALDNVRMLSQQDNNLWINEQPVSQLVVSGSTATLSAFAGQSRATYQWYKNDVEIHNAFQPIYKILNVQPSDGARYKCIVQANGYSLESNEVYLGVIEPLTFSPLHVLPDRSFSLGVKFHPAELNQVSYSWKLGSGAALSSVGDISGASTPVLKVEGVRAAAEATYFCEVHFHHVAVLNVGPFDVKLLRPPQITNERYVYLLEGAVVDIPVLTSDPEALITIGDLPSGLSFNAHTKRITGRITEFKEHLIWIHADNAYGHSTIGMYLYVRRFPSHLVGTYQGVFLEGEGEYQHGGQITCQVTQKGSASGTLMLRGKTHRFTSTLSDRKLSEGVIFEAPFKDIDGRELLVGIRQAEDLLIYATPPQYETYIRELRAEVDDNLGEGLAMRNSWFSTKKAPEPGVLNAALTASESTVFPEPPPPQGAGYLSLNLSPRGTVKIKGRLADGQAILGSTILGDGRDMPIFMNLYRGTGSFVTVVNHVRSTLSGTATWGKDAQPAKSKDRIHKEGFARHALEVKGGNYSRLNPASAWYEGGWALNLTGAGLDAETGLSQNFVFDRGRAVFPRLPAENTHKFTFNLNPTTGLFTGGFKLQDENPAKPGQMLRRSATFHGCVIPDQETLPIGHFLLPELPEGKNTKTPIWSGKVEVLRLRE